jgi:hypothetical protein
VDKSTKPCTKCGEEIYFDENIKSPNGKWIPIDAITNQPHNCSRSSFSRYTVSDEIIDLEERENERIKRISYE